MSFGIGYDVVENSFHQPYRRIENFSSIGVLILGISGLVIEVWEIGCIIVANIYHSYRRGRMSGNIVVDEFVRIDFGILTPVRLFKAQRFNLSLEGRHGIAYTSHQVFDRNRIDATNGIGKLNAFFMQFCIHFQLFPVGRECRQGLDHCMTSASYLTLL